MLEDSSCSLESAAAALACYFLSFVGQKRNLRHVKLSLFISNTVIVR